MYRIEKDALGERQIPADALYGIHALRAKENFPGNTIFPIEWYRAVGVTKHACYLTYLKFRDAANKKSGQIPHLNFIGNDILKPLIDAAREVSEGLYFDQFIVPAVQGGAGTSINMNINEIITNTALVKSGHKIGEYDIIDPIEHANVCQSTNDVIPTALTIAVMTLLQALEERINILRQKVEKLEKANRENLARGTHRCRRPCPLHSGCCSAHIMKHYPAIGGGFQSALKESDR